MKTSLYYVFRSLITTDKFETLSMEFYKEREKGECKFINQGRIEVTNGKALEIQTFTNILLLAHFYINRSTSKRRLLCVRNSKDDRVQTLFMTEMYPDVFEI